MCMYSVSADGVTKRKNFLIFNFTKTKKKCYSLKESFYFALESLISYDNVSGHFVLKNFDKKQIETLSNSNILLITY